MKHLQQKDELRIVRLLDEPGKPTSRPDLVKEVEVRVPLTIAVPLIAVSGVALVVGLFALVLMRLPQNHAPVAAGILGVVIIAATVLVAARKELNKRTIIELSALIVYPVALAAILVYVVGLSTGPAEENASGPAVTDAASVTLTAENLSFTESELEFPAGEDVMLTLDNQDAAPHNVSIYKDDGLDQDFFTGDNVEPGGSLDYEIPALAAGAYYFRCDLHPTMDGRLLVE